MSLADNERFFSKSRVIPVLTPQAAAEGVAVSRALFEGGLHLHEVTLRTPAGIETIAALRKEIPDLIVGAGSVLTAELGQRAIAAGASFLVSPGTTDALLDFAAACPVPFLPGAGSVSEAMFLLASGCRLAKFFPAEPLGGVQFLQAVAGPLTAMKFCPTGGVTAQNAPDYLKLANVTAVGGSWMAPHDLVKTKDFAAIRRLAEQASSL